MKIYEYLDLIYGTIEQNKSSLGVIDVYKHQDFSVMFSTPSIFCEIGELKPSESSEEGHNYSVSATIIVSTSDGINTARSISVDIVDGIENLFLGDFGLDEYPPTLESAEFGVGVMNGADYFFAELLLTTDT